MADTDQTVFRLGLRCASNEENKFGLQTYVVVVVVAEYL